MHYNLPMLFSALLPSQWYSFPLKYSSQTCTHFFQCCTQFLNAIWLVLKYHHWQHEVHHVKKIGGPSVLLKNRNFMVPGQVWNTSWALCLAVVLLCLWSAQSDTVPMEEPCLMQCRQKDGKKLKLSLTSASCHEGTWWSGGVYYGEVLFL
jgi:hypothetical protein